MRESDSHILLHLLSVFFTKCSEYLLTWQGAAQYPILTERLRVSDRIDFALIPVEASRGQPRDC